MRDTISRLMLRLILLSLILGAGMCQTDASTAPGGAVGSSSSMSADAPSPEADRDPVDPSSDVKPEDVGATAEAARPDFPYGTWQLTETNGGPVSQVAVITWTFRADGTGVYAQDIQNPMMNAADGNRPFRWTRVGDGVVRSESSTFTRTSERSARWSDSGSTGTLQRWE